MARSRTSSVPAAPADPLSPVQPEHLDIPGALRRVIGFVNGGSVRTYLVYNEADTAPERRRRKENSNAVLGLLRRICRDGSTLTAEQVEGLLLRAGQIAIDIDPATSADSDAAAYVKRMLCTSGLFAAIRVQKVPKGVKSTDRFPDVPLACLGTLVDLGAAPQASASGELTDGGMPLGTHVGAQPVTV